MVVERGRSAGEDPQVQAKGNQGLDSKQLGNGHDLLRRLDFFILVG